MASYHVSGTYKTWGGSIGRFTYRRIEADSHEKAMELATDRVRARKSHMGGLDMSASLNA